jgi:hypothetical protein
MLINPLWWFISFSLAVPESLNSSLPPLEGGENLTKNKKSLNAPTGYYLIFWLGEKEKKKNILGTTREREERRRRKPVPMFFLSEKIFLVQSFHIRIHTCNIYTYIILLLFFRAVAMWKKKNSFHRPPCLFLSSFLFGVRSPFSFKFYWGALTNSTNDARFWETSFQLFCVTPRCTQEKQVACSGLPGTAGTAQTHTHTHPCVSYFFVCVETKRKMARQPDLYELVAYWVLVVWIEMHANK